MTTTHDKAIAAYKAIQTIGGKTAKAAVSLQLFRLKKNLRDAVDFVTEEEQKLVEQVGGKVTEEGMILIADPEKRAEFARRQVEIYKAEYEVPDKVTLRADDLPDISVAELDALDDFVNFE